MANITGTLNFTGSNSLILSSSTIFISGRFFIYSGSIQANFFVSGSFSFYSQTKCNFINSKMIISSSGTFYHFGSGLLTSDANSLIVNYGNYFVSPLSKDPLFLNVPILTQTTFLSKTLTLL